MGYASPQNGQTAMLPERGRPMDPGDTVTLLMSQTVSPASSISLRISPSSCEDLLLAFMNQECSSGHPRSFSTDRLTRTPLPVYLS